MNVTTNKSANQLWKEEQAKGLTRGNSKQDFKNWLQRKKASGFFNVTGTADVPVNTTLNSGIQDMISQLHEEGGLQTKANTKYVFGLNKTAVIWTGIGIGILVTGVIAYKIIRRK